MHLPNDALERMSRGMREGLKKRIGANGQVPQEMWVEVEKLMNDQGLGWCDKHMTWHTQDPLLGASGPFAPPYHGCPRFVPIKPNVIDKMLQTPNPYDIENFRQMEEQIRKLSQSKAFQQQIQRVQEQHQKQQIEELMRQMESLQEQQENNKKRQKWLFKRMNQCPDCKGETVTHERKSGPEPQDPLDKIVYTAEPCGCQNIKF